MKKAQKKHAKKKLNSKEQIQDVVDKLKYLLANHGVLVMFILAGSAIGLALFKSTTYLSPARDENKYQELTTKTYSKIDYALVTKLSQALNDIDITISPDKNPDRNNPFSE